MKLSFVNRISKMLRLGQEVISSFSILGEDEGTINIKGDKTIGMNLKIEPAMIWA